MRGVGRHRCADKRPLRLSMLGLSQAELEAFDITKLHPAQLEGVEVPEPQPEPAGKVFRPRTSLPLWIVPCPDGRWRLLAVEPTGWCPRP